MGWKIGLNCTLKRGAAGSTATTVVKNAKEVTISLSRGAADATTRNSGSWKEYIVGLIDGGLTFTMLEGNDEDFTAFQSAFIAGTPVSIWAGDTESGGLDFDAIVTKFDLEQGDEDTASASVELKPYAGTRRPSWTAGTGSSSSVGA